MPTFRRIAKSAAEVRDTGTAQPPPNSDGFWEDTLTFAVAQLVVGRKRRRRGQRPAPKDAWVKLGE